MAVVTTIVIIMVYASFALFVAAALSKKHKEKLGKIFGWVFVVTLVSIALWGLLRNIPLILERL